MKLFWLPLVMLVLLAQNISAQTCKNADAILGMWKADEKALTIEVYRVGSRYNARIASFTDHHSKVPAAEQRDAKNPDPKLRNRRMIGLEVLTNLVFNASDEQWINGTIYNAKSGKRYSAMAEMTSKNTLSVRAYKGFSMLGKTMTFTR